MEQLIKFLLENKYQLIEFSIVYLPTILFVFIVTISVLLSFLRGIRKTSIFLLHTIIAFIICVILFVALVEVKEVDAFILKTVNSIMGDNRMQSLFGVSNDCKTFREIFIEYIPKQLNFMDGLALIAKDNGRYLSSLVDVTYRLVFGIVLYVLFYILKFLMWIIYIIFFNERKYIKKREKKYENGLVDSPYRKRRLLSSIIGLGKGLVAALVMLSFIGMFYYIIAGGVGDKKREKLEFDNPDIQFAYNAYSEIESYGTGGIFKVLNSIRNERNMPYYLFAANMIFQGRVYDEYDNATNVYLVDELSKLVSFSRDTFDLFLKYDDKNILKMISDGEQINIMEEIITVFKNTDFQNEFEELITSFESSTFFINLTYSFIDSLSSHLSDVSFTKGLSEDILVPLKIMFEKGYLCPDIPYEKELIDKKHIEEEKSSYNENDYILGHIKPSDLLTQDDIVLIYRLMVNYLNSAKEAEDGLKNILNILKDSMTYIKELSILDSSRSDELDGIFKRLYAYLEIKYLEGDSDIAYKIYDVDSNSYISPQYDSIHWVEEFDLLLEMVDKGFDIYDKYFIDGKEMKDVIIEIFGSNDKDIDRLMSKMTSSRLVGELFTSKKVVDIVISMVEGISPNMSVPNDLSFGNIYDKDGHFEDFGELFYMFKGFKQILSSQEGKDLLSSLSSGEVDTKNMLNQLSSLLTREIDNEKLSDTIINSTLLSSLLSNYLITNSNISDTISIYIDDSILVHDDSGNTLNIITRDELEALFNSIPTFIEIAKPMIDGEELTQNDYINLISDERVINMLNSKVIEGSISLIIANNISPDGFLVCPQSMKDGVNLVTIDNHYSEIMRLINVKDALDIDIAELMSDEIDSNKVFNIFKDLDSKDIDLLLSSNILYYSISKYLNEKTDTLFGNLELIIPESANTVLENDTLPKVIKKETLKELINDISMIAINDEIEMMSLLAKVIRESYVMDNYIISASVANALVNDSDLQALRDVLVIDDKYDGTHYGKTELLKGEFEKNPWYQESRALINALHIVLDLKEDESIDTSEISTKILNNVNSLNDKIEGTKYTKLDKVYESDIFVGTLSRELDDKLDSETIDDGVKNLAKSSNDKYRKTEISGMVDALTILELDFNNIDSFNTNKFKENADNDKLYESIIIRGVLTKKIRENLVNNSNIIIIDKCYDGEGDAKVFKRAELTTLFSLTKGLDRVEDINYDNISISDVIDYIYKDGVTKSYIMVATISNKLLGNDTLIIPMTATESMKSDDEDVLIIKPKELKELIDGVSAFGIDITGNDLNVPADKDLPTDDNSIRIICKSDILRATITSKLRIEGKTLYVEKQSKYVTVTTDTNNEFIAVLSDLELRNFIAAINTVTGGKEMNNIEFNYSYSNVTTLDESAKEVILNSSIATILITMVDEATLEQTPALQLIVQSITVVDLSEITNETIKVVPKDYINITI